MISRRIILTAIFSVVFIASNIAFADSSDLLRMDLKKASSEDTVDVTFYTTGTPTNTVVTRKTGNTYVVLLPNVAGNQSIVPSLGGVKELISDVKVKNVDDGIGGYTKITFNTTKPVKIQTYTKKTAPLTKAQQDYKNLIVKNSKFDPDKKIENFKQANNVKPSNKTVSDVIKTATTIPVKQEVKTKDTSSKTSKIETNKSNETKIAIKPIEVHVPQIKQEKTKTQQQQITEQKADNNVVKTPQTTSAAAVKPAFDLVNPPVSKALKNTDKKQSNKKVKTKVVRKELPIMSVAGVLSVIGLFILVVFMNIISRAVKNNTKLKEYLENYNSEPANTNNVNYDNIIENENLNWQEKYKLYSKTKQEQNTKTESSYITNMEGTNGVILSNDMQTRVAQMEHALSQTSSIQEVDKNTIKPKNPSGNISGLNLKSFAKNINLKKTSRNTIPDEQYNYVTEPLKEGKFVNLDNSELTMSQRNIGGHGLSISDLLRTGRRYLSKKHSSEEFSKQQEQYLISSMEEYLNIIDSEENKKEKNITEEITNLIPKRSRADMMLSTNPMSTQKYINKQTAKETSDFGISVTSKYDIDNDKSIYMIESDGISALIGKIGENITVLKKFDKVVKKPLQVRLDYGNVYIVKVGDFKCLVDVAEDKMGTLLEI